MKIKYLKTQRAPADLCGMMWQHQSHSLLRTARFVVLEKGA